MNTLAPEEAGFSSERLGRIGAVMQHYVDENKVAGFITLVARYGGVVHHERFGMMDVEESKPMQFDTIFRIYSMTKPITSVALMMLFEQGLVRLTDPVSRFMPAFGEVKVLGNDGSLVEPDRAITIQDLLRHTAGLSYDGYYEETGELVDKLYDEVDLWPPGATSEEMVRRIAELPLAFQPGEAWRYSVATDIVGRVVELVSDMSLAQFFEEKILKPLGMEETAFSVPPEKADRLATLYGEAEEGGLEEVDAAVGGDYFDVTLHSGGHGLVSTVADYHRLAKFLLNKGELNGVRLLGPRTVELMTANHLPPAVLPIAMGAEPMPGLGFGLGFSVMLDVALSGMMGSPGLYSWGGWAKTHFWVDPEEELIGILMVQQIHTGSHPAVIDFRTLVYQALVD
ncbi:MAG: serine hydrolase domain-containing protein [Anaerolineae bacterium]|jgi:CubicO group peptidase (beta-lactamase class C family)